MVTTGGKRKVSYRFIFWYRCMIGERGEERKGFVWWRMRVMMDGDMAGRAIFRMNG